MNPTRSCPICTQADDHPRHVQDIGGGITVAYHMDCHVQVADCEVCRAQIDGAGGATGEELREHLLSTASDPDAPGWTAPADTVEG